MTAFALPRAVPFGLRASVSSICNMDCSYCPRHTSMEDYTPRIHRSRGIGHEGYRTVLTSLLSALRFTSVSLTGGEPLTNPHLPDILEHIRALVPRLELNTNGLLVTPRRWKRLAPFVDRVKISLDTLDEELFKEVTKAAGRNPLRRVLDALETITDSGVEVALNCVVSRDTLPTLDELIAFAVEGGVRLHLLDYYFTEERRENWQRQFVPLESVMPSLGQRFGPPASEPIFGCGFYSYTVGDAVIRVKTSYSGTMRASRCATCSHYCQEGMYGLKLSTHGWVTTCPSNEVEDGILLTPTMDAERMYAVLAPLLADLGSTVHQPDSMAELIERHDLRPAIDQVAPLSGRDSTRTVGMGEDIPW